MLVKLPRKCLGQEIVEAFRKASAFQEGPKRRFEPHDFGVEYQFEAGSVKQAIRSMGVFTRPSYLAKKWIFFGPQVWREGSSPAFRLEPIMLSKKYGAIEVTVMIDYDGYNEGWLIITSPKNPNFESVRPQFEKILGQFFARLQPS